MSDDLRSEIRELATADAVTEARLLLEEIRDRHRDFLLTFDFMVNVIQARENKLLEIISELRRELDRIRADFRTEATLLHLIRPDETGGSYGPKEEGRGTEGTYTKTNRFSS